MKEREDSVREQHVVLGEPCIHSEWRSDESFVDRQNEGPRGRTLRVCVFD